MTAEIKLPPLPCGEMVPRLSEYGFYYDDKEMQSYATAAVLADRQALWLPIETAPTTPLAGEFSNPRVLLLREDGEIGIGYYDSDKYVKRPKPYWTDDRNFLGIRWMRDSKPIAWMPLPPAPQPVAADHIAGAGKVIDEGEA